MKIQVSVTRDNGADYLPQTVKRVVSLQEAETIVTFAILSALGASDSAFVAAEMRGSLEKRSATAWGWNDNLRRVIIRCEKVTV